MKVLTSLNLNQNELQNAVLQPLASAPSNPKLGQIYYNSTSGTIETYNGSSWKVAGNVVEDSETNGKLLINGVEVDVYTLPTAKSTELGGIIPGAGINVADDGTASIDITYYTGVRGEGETDNAVITRVLNGATPHDGDIFTIKTLINGDKYSYMAYVYDNGNWGAMDGNVDATNVILRSDIVTAGDYTQVGNVTKGKTATGSITAAGKSIADVLTAIFTKELNPSKSDPYVTITFSQSGAKEVGTSVTPSYTCTLEPGSYTYGPATGITATAWSVTDNASPANTSTAASGSFPAFVVGDSTNYTITAEASHDAGAIPLTNLKNEYASAQIAAGTKSKTSGAVTGFRSFFYGSKTAAVELTSANIRGLTNSGKAVGTSQEFSLEVVEGAKQVIVAFPTSTGKTLSKVLDTVAFGTDIVGSFVKSTVDVEGVNGYTAVSYDVYVYTPDTALGANTYTVTIA